MIRMCDCRFEATADATRLCAVRNRGKAKGATREQRRADGRDLRAREGSTAKRARQQERAQ
eukprot:483081-Pleurochrysis_carterae.AAC.1